MNKKKTIAGKAGRILLALVLTVMTVFGTVIPSFAATPTDLLKIKAELVNTLSTVQLPSGGQGTFTVSIKVTNTDSVSHTVKVVPDVSANRASVALSAVSAAGIHTGGIVLASASDLSGNSKTVSFTFAVVNASTAMYTIPFDIYQDGTKAASALTATVKVVVAEGETTSVIDTDTPVYKPAASLSFRVDGENGILKTGNDNNLTLTMTNTGDCNLTNAEIRLGTLPTGIAIYNATDRKQLGTLNRAAYSSKDVSASANFSISVKDTVTTGIYAFPVTLYGLDPNGAAYSVTETVYLQVSGKDDETEETDSKTGIKTPILMVSSYSQTGDALAGTVFGLNLTVRNTSAEELRNIKVVIGDGGGVFVPSGSSNAYYIASVKAGETNTHSMNLSVGRDANQVTTPVTVSMTYEDTDGNSYSATDTIAIPVIQETRFVVDTMEAITYAWVNETVSSSIQFYNMGRNTISNVKVTVSGDFTVTKNGSVFVGNMASGSSSTVKFNLMPVNVGTNSGVITFTYDDASGNTLTQEVPFTFEAQGYTEPDPGEYEDSGYYEEPTAEKTVPWKWIGIGAAVVLIVVLLVLRSVKKKKAAKALELEFEDEPKEKENK